MSGEGGRLVLVVSARADLARIRRFLRTAGAVRRELLAVYVEDRALLAVAGLPFVRLVGPFGRVEPLTPEQVRRTLRLHALRVEEEIRRVADGNGLLWRFVAVSEEVEVGVAPQDVLALTPEDAALVLEALGPEVLTRDGPLVLLTGEGGRLVLATAGDGRAVEVAQRLAAALHVPLVVLAVGDAAFEVRARLGGDVAIVPISDASALKDRLAALIQRGTSCVVADPALAPAAVEAAGKGPGPARAEPSPEPEDR
ncbi:hypothetical protein HRbin39_01474 [bacterium HR39]|nr:hypothetical protein HRbin39_01474 [bacterium HR39]